ncbi:MAG: hypothetical protein B6242_13885 [Anaerolineaceae bacterium 4572_78]|nr:MAG: hypothetical protein B6242_13885 [Anaerolineaceae bacterium 4572_78]
MKNHKYILFISFILLNAMIVFQSLQTTAAYHQPITVHVATNNMAIDLMSPIKGTLPITGTLPVTGTFLVTKTPTIKHMTSSSGDAKGGMVLAIGGNDFDSQIYYQKNITVTNA